MNREIFNISKVVFLIGEVIFDCNCPEEPPDFIFGPDDEDFLPPMEEMEVKIKIYSFFMNRFCIFL